MGNARERRPAATLPFCAKETPDIPTLILSRQFIPSYKYPH